MTDDTHDEPGRTDDDDDRTALFRRLAADYDLDEGRGLEFDEIEHLFTDALDDLEARADELAPADYAATDDGPGPDPYAFGADVHWVATNINAALYRTRRARDGDVPSAARDAAAANANSRVADGLDDHIEALTGLHDRLTGVVVEADGVTVERSGRRIETRVANPIGGALDFAWEAEYGITGDAPPVPVERDDDGHVED